MNSNVVDGRMTAKPTLLYSKDNNAFSTFTIANNEGYGDKKKVSFIDCVCFGKVAENVAKYCDKGSHVIVGGRLDQSHWVAKDGSKRSALKITANQVQFLDSKPKTENSENGTEKYNNYKNAISNPWADKNEKEKNDNDIPF